MTSNQSFKYDYFTLTASKIARFKFQAQCTKQPAIIAVEIINNGRGWAFDSLTFAFKD